MKLLRSLMELAGYSVQATDGTIGKVSEFYFDDTKWGIRYLVVDTGTWLTGKKVLLSPTVLNQPDWKERALPVSLSMHDVRTSPDVDTDKPVARQHELGLHKHYGWEVYWAGEAIVGSPEITSAAFSSTREVANKYGKPFDPHLRTTKVICGCLVHALDGEVGHIADFIVDDGTWSIRYLVIDTGTRKVLVPPEWKNNIDWQERTVFFNVTQDKVANSPLFNPSEPVNRGFEESVFDYFGRPQTQYLSKDARFVRIDAAARTNSALALRQA